MAKMNFAFSLFLLVLGYPISTMANFSGVIKDAETGKPIQGASVYFTDMKMGTTSKENGFFSIQHISDGVHFIEISHIGYTTYASNIQIIGNSTKEFLLKPTIVENNAIVVTGVSKATQLKKIPFQVSVMRKQDLLQTTAMNIIESITSKAGIAAISSGPSISKPVIRGLGYNRVLTMNDGVRQEGQQWGDEHGIEIDDASVNKMEVLKGPASLVYGSDAMAGVINIITNVPVPTNTVKLNVLSAYQSNNRLRTFHADFAGNKNNINWNIYSTIKQASDYQNVYDGYVFNSKFNEHNAGGYLGYNTASGFSHIIFSSFNLNTGLIDGDRDSMGNFIKYLNGNETSTPSKQDFLSVQPNIPFQHIRHMKLVSDNSYKLGNQHLNINIAAQHNQREEFGNPSDINERSLFFDLKTITYSTQYHFHEKNGWKNSIGSNGMNQQNRNLGVEQIIPDYSLLDYGLFVFSQKELKKMNFSGGFRLDTRSIKAKPLMESNSIKSDAFSIRFSNYSGSIGVAYLMNENSTFKANIARAFRAPSVSELSSNGAHEGTLRYEYGNKNLSSEVSMQSDVSVEFTTPHFSINLAGYLNFINNFIFYRKLSNTAGTDSVINVNGTDLTAFTFDQHAAQLKGFECTLDIHPHPLDWLHIENSFSYVAGQFNESIDGSKHLPFIPAPKLQTECRADIKKINSLFRNGYIKCSIENYFKQNKAFTAYNTETTTKGYSLLNLSFGTEVITKKHQQICSIHFSATNIMNVAYQNHLSRLKYASENIRTNRQGVFNVGRNFGIKLNMPLNFSLK